MSRRRGRSRVEHAAPRVAVVCTDRGQHERVRLQRLVDHRANPDEVTENDLEEFRTLCRDFGVPAPDNLRAYRQDGITFSGPGTSWTATSGRRIAPYWPPAGGVRADGGATFSFVCTVCGRDAQLRAERLGQALDATYARDPSGSGPWEIDVSWSD